MWSEQNGSYSAGDIFKKKNTEREYHLILISISQTYIARAHFYKNAIIGSGTAWRWTANK